MTRFHRNIVRSWAETVSRAIQLGEDDAAYRLTIGLVRRVRELGYIA